MKNAVLKAYRCLSSTRSERREQSFVKRFSVYEKFWQLTLDFSFWRTNQHNSDLPVVPKQPEDRHERPGSVLGYSELFVVARTSMQDAGRALTAARHGQEAEEGD